MPIKGTTVKTDRNHALVPVRFYCLSLFRINYLIPLPSAGSLRKPGYPSTPVESDSYPDCIRQSSRKNPRRSRPSRVITWMKDRSVKSAFFPLSQLFFQAPGVERSVNRPKGKHMQPFLHVLNPRFLWYFANFPGALTLLPRRRVMRLLRHHMNYIKFYIIRNAKSIVTLLISIKITFSFPQKSGRPAKPRCVSAAKISAAYEILRIEHVFVKTFKCFLYP